MASGTVTSAPSVKLPSVESARATPSISDRALVYSASCSGAAPKSTSGPTTNGASISLTAISSSRTRATRLVVDDSGNDAAVVSPVAIPARAATEIPPRTRSATTTVTAGRATDNRTTRSVSPGFTTGPTMPPALPNPPPNSDTSSPRTSTPANPAARTARVVA